VKSQILFRFRGKLLAKVIFTLVLFSVSLLLIPIGNIEASSEKQCPNSLAGIWTVMPDYASLVSMNGYFMTIPLDWDSTLVNGNYKFYPCENPNVTFTFQQFTGVNNALTTEQLADGYISKYFSNVEGYHVLESHYKKGTQEYLVLATIGDSELETIQHGFIPVIGLTGPELFVATYSADSHELFQKYSSSAAKIYNSIVSVPQSWLTRIQEQNAAKQQQQQQGLNIIEDMIADASAQSTNHVLGLLDKQTQLDAAAREDSDDWYNCEGAYRARAGC